MEGANGTSINTNPLIYMCEVRTRREDDIKKEREVKKGGEKEKETLEQGGWSLQLAPSMGRVANTSSML